MVMILAALMVAVAEGLLYRDRDSYRTRRRPLILMKILRRSWVCGRCNSLQYKVIILATTNWPWSYLIDLHFDLFLFMFSLSTVSGTKLTFLFFLGFFRTSRTLGATSGGFAYSTPPKISYAQTQKASAPYPRIPFLDHKGGGRPQVPLVGL